MRTIGRDLCPLCGSTGAALYEKLRDRLFHTPGEWALRHCGGKACGLVWLDPAPHPDDVGAVYENYYTHHGVSSGAPRRRFARLQIRRACHVLSIIIGLRRKRVSLYHYGLEQGSRGRLLELGCGDGKRLEALYRLGWDAVGQDVDPNAVETARTRGNSTVHLGRLEDLGLAERQFDVVASNHVIEHVFDTTDFLVQSLKLLKPGGKLIALTPNVEGFGARHFGADWMGLDPPRHYHLFSPTTLHTAATKAGYVDVEVRTSPANTQVFAAGSLDCQRHGDHDMANGARVDSEIQGFIYQLEALRKWRQDPQCGDELFLAARRPSS